MNNFHRQEKYVSTLPLSLTRIAAWYVENAELAASSYLGSADALPREIEEPNLVTREDWNLLVRYVRGASHG